jgi:hypothetical protein
VALVAYIALHRLIRPLWFELKDMDLAVLLDGRMPGIAQRVATVLQLPRLIEGRIQASPSMVEAAVTGDAAALGQADFFNALNQSRRHRSTGFLAAAVLLPLVFSLIWAPTASLWAQRWLLGWEVRWPQKTYLEVAGLDHDRLLVPRSEPLVLQVAAKPGSKVPEQVSMRYRPEGGGWKQANFSRFDLNDFRAELPPVMEPVRLTIRGGDDWLGPIFVEPIDRPTLEKLTIRVLRDPVRPAGETRSFDGTDSQLLFLRKTELKLQVSSRQALLDAKLNARAGQPPPLERVDERSFSARWTMQEPLLLELLLVGREGGLNSRPYALSIGLLKDREPRVTLRSSGVGQRVTAMARIPLTYRASDDFGIGQLALDLERAVPGDQQGEKQEAPVHIELDPPTDLEATEVERQPSVLLRDFAAGPGTTVRLRGSASDNCAEGTQAGFSRWLTFRVVPAEELFHEILMRQRAERAKFRNALGVAKSQAEALETAVMHEQVDGLIRRHQVVERQVWQVANRLDESLTEMKLNELGSPQAMELLHTQVISPMRALHTDAMAAMRKALERLAAEKDSLEPHLPPVREQQQQIVETMERILEQMAQWESFVDVVNQLRQIMQLQDKVLKQTEELRQKRTKDVFDE